MEHDLAMAQRAALKSSYHHGDLESALIEAAISLVRKYGPDHLSLRAVSAEVVVSPSASYHYFQDKDSLVSAVGEVLFEQLAEMQVQFAELLKMLPTKDEMPGLLDDISLP